MTQRNHPLSILAPSVAAAIAMCLISHTASAAALPSPAQLVAQHSNKCLTSVSAGGGNGGTFEQWGCTANVETQAFTLEHVMGRKYRIVTPSRRCLEVRGGSKADGAVIDQRDCNGSKKQSWKLGDVGGGVTTVVSSATGKCLDVTGGPQAIDDGVPIEQWSCVPGATNQAWRVQPLSDKPVCPHPALTPAVATQAQWDGLYDPQYHDTLPNTSGGAEDFAWHGHYWVRAYISMAATYGDLKYFERASKMIDFWIAHTDGPQGWGTNLGPSQMGLDTGVISSAIALFAHQAWKDPRFAAYRTKADSYLAVIEPILRSYNPQWVDDAPFPGHPSFYVYATCGGICGKNSLLMYNQGAALAKALLLIDRTKRLAGQVPDPDYAYKADKAAAYFKTFAVVSNGGYVWNYEGARLDQVPTIEDNSHAHLDLSLLVWARNAGMGGLTGTDMQWLVGTMKTVTNGAPGPNDVSHSVDGSGAPSDDFRVPIGYDWIDLVDYDTTLLDKAINVYNLHLPNPNAVSTSRARAYLGWSEIQRKKACVSLY